MSKNDKHHRRARSPVVDAVLDDWNPSTGVESAVARAQTRRAAEYLAATGDPLGRTELVDRLADGSTLDAATWWGRAVDPGLRQLADAELVEYHAVGDTYQWGRRGRTMNRDDADRKDAGDGPEPVPESDPRHIDPAGDLADAVETGELELSLADDQSVDEFREFVERAEAGEFDPVDPGLEAQVRIARSLLDDVDDE